MDKTWAILALVTLLAGGCGKGGMSWFQASDPAQAPAESADDEGFTVLLTAFAGQDHVTVANSYRKSTEAATHWRNVYVVHEDSISNIYWGRYSNLEDAGKSLRTAQQWNRSGIEYPFASAMIVRIPGNNPGRPEYDLRNATGFYTLVIAHFYNDPEEGVKNRKQYAVDNCEELRKQGVEAYYFHGPRVSMVTVGSFPEKAYVTMTSEKEGYAMAVPNSDALKQVWDKYPCLAVNGYREQSTEVGIVSGKLEKKASPSYVFQIPRNTSTFAIPDRSGNPQPR